jgi:Tol biopolymer transport system component
MPDVEEVFRMATNKVRPDPNALERQARRQRSRARHTRAGAYVAVAAVIVILALTAFAALLTANGEGSIPDDTGATPPDLSLATTLLPTAQPQTAAVVDLEGHQTAKTPGFSVDGWAPSVSADGSTIAYVAAPPALGYNQIVLMRADGSDPHVVSTPHVIAWSVALSPDGSRIAFEGDGGEGSNIYVVNADGSGLRQLTSDPATDQLPAWSPDGTTIAYDNAGKHEQQDAQYSETAEIFTVPADGGPVTRITRNDGFDAAPSYSPDGTMIVDQSFRGFSLMDADGGHYRRLDTPISGFTPRWSPNGETIAVSYYVDTYRPVVQLGSDFGDWPLCPIALIDVSSGKVTRFPNVTMATDINTPQWLDDGHLLVMRVPAKDPTLSG